MKRNMSWLSLLLCILLTLTLCGCNREQKAGGGEIIGIDAEPASGAALSQEDEEAPETLHFINFTEMAESAEMTMTFRLDWADFRILTREEQGKLADILQKAQLSQRSWEGAPLFLVKYCTSDSALPYEMQYLLFAQKDGQTLCRGRDNASWFSLPEEELAQLWLDMGLEPELLYDENRTVYGSMESCPEGQRIYTLPEKDAASPEEALELLFAQFLETQKEAEAERTYRLLDVKSTECQLYDRAYIAANDGDWGWANDPEQMGENEWCTFCSAGVTCLGTLNTYSPDSFGTQSVGDAVRWGRLWLENGTYSFYPACWSTDAAVGEN